MNTLLKTGALVVATLALAACESDSLMDPSAGKTKSTYSALSAELQSRYAALAAEESEQKDYADAAHYEKKAVEAGGGFEVMPDGMDTRSVAADKVVDLGEARERLMAKYDEGYAESQPADLAAAQTQWDCWFEQQAEGYQLLHIQRCREGFEAAMQRMTPAPTPPAAGPAAQMEDIQHIIYFRHDSADLTNLAKGRIQTAVGDAAKRQSPVVTVVGHTDTSGSLSYNQALSDRRANAVADFMEQNGVSATVISASGVGENDLAEQTGDDVKNANNRRVTITISGQ